MNVIMLLRGFSPAEPRSKSSLPMRHAPKESEKTRRKIPIDEGNGGEKERAVGVRVQAGPEAQVGHVHNFRRRKKVGEKVGEKAENKAG